MSFRSILSAFASSASSRASIVRSSTVASRVQRPSVGKLRRGYDDYVGVILAGLLALALGACSSGRSGAAPTTARSEAKAAGTTKPASAISYTTIEQALTGPGGLTVCDDPTTGGSDFSGAYEHRSYSVVAGTCPTDSSAGERVLKSSTVVTSLYSSARVRDQALVTSFGDRLVAWSLGSNAIFDVTESARPEVITAAEKAMTSLSATKGYDGR